MLGKKGKRRQHEGSNRKGEKRSRESPTATGRTERGSIIFGGKRGGESAPSLKGKKREKQVVEMKKVADTPGVSMPSPHGG